MTTCRTPGIGMNGGLFSYPHFSAVQSPWCSMDMNGTGILSGISTLFTGRNRFFSPVFFSLPGLFRSPPPAVNPFCRGGWIGLDLSSIQHPTTGLRDPFQGPLPWWHWSGVSPPGSSSLPWPHHFSFFPLFSFIPFIICPGPAIHSRQSMHPSPHFPYSPWSFHCSWIWLSWFSFFRPGSGPGPS